MPWLSLFVNSCNVVSLATEEIKINSGGNKKPFSHSLLCRVPQELAVEIQVVLKYLRWILEVVFCTFYLFFVALGQSLKEVQGTNIQAERVHGGLNLNLTFRLLHLTSYSPKNPFNGVYYCYKFINWQTL